MSLTSSGTPDPETDLHLLLTDRFDSWLVTWSRGGGAGRVFLFFISICGVLEQKWKRDGECLNNFNSHSARQYLVHTYM